MNLKNLIKSISIIIIFFLTLSSGFVITSAEQNELKLKITPSTSFINALNLAPGDSITSDIIIRNDVLVDVNIKSRIQSGSNLLYNILDLNVIDGSEILYKGKLQGFENLIIKSVTEKGKRLKFTVTLPKYSNNELQGQKVMVAFDFITKNSDLNPPWKGSLPDTATNTFNYLIVGIILLISGCILKTTQKRIKD
jgi:hypothetical protein